MTEDTEERAAEIARLITSSVAGRRWAELSPIDIARHLVANGVEVITPVDATEDWTCEHGVVIGSGCDEYGCGDTPPSGMAAAETVARLDSYTQERHEEEIRAAQVRIEGRKMARRVRARGAAARVRGDYA